jgi:hypothetical protein
LLNMFSLFPPHLYDWLFVATIFDAGIKGSSDSNAQLLLYYCMTRDIHLKQGLKIYKKMSIYTLIKE